VTTSMVADLRSVVIIVASFVCKTSVGQHQTMKPTKPLPVHTPATGARWAGPREHGRQAARSKRDRPSGHASRTTEPRPRRRRRRLTP
jgi:hypothetical protein